MMSRTAELEELVDSTVSIPTIPNILNEINAVFASPEGSAKDAARVSETDPAIAARVLRLVNSSVYGLKSPVSAIHLACSIVGLKVIRNVVVQATVMGTFGKVRGIEGFDADWLWDHSFKTALAARLLAQETRLGKALGKDDAYTCGLIHDIGKMVLAQSAAPRFAEALEYSKRTGMPLAKAEGEVLGFTHAHVAGLLAERWNLSPDLQIAVSYHHSSGTDAEEWTKGFLIHAANMIAHQEATGNGGWIGDCGAPEALSAMQVPEETMQTIRQHVRQATMTR